MRVNHPTLAGVSKNVPDERAKKWLSNGWTEVKPVTVPAPVKPAAKKTAAKKPAPKS